MRTLTRRCFLAALGAVGCGAGAGSRATARPPAPTDAPCTLPAPGYRFLTPLEARFVEAACHRLIPPDRAGPGALEAGVPAYVDAQLAGEWGTGRAAYRTGPWQPGTTARLTPAGAADTPAGAFRGALAAIHRDLGRRRIDFVTAPAAAQAGYLHGLETGAVALECASSAAFFATLLAMTVEGFVGHPQFGATRDRVAWRLRGFPGACAQPVACVPPA